MTFPSFITITKENDEYHLYVDGKYFDSYSSKEELENEATAIVRERHKVSPRQAIDYCIPADKEYLMNLSREMQNLSLEEIGAQITEVYNRLEMLRAIFISKSLQRSKRQEKESREFMAIVKAVKAQERETKERQKIGRSLRGWEKKLFTETGKLPKEIAKDLFEKYFN